MSAAGIAFGLFIVLWLPRHLPINVESPAGELAPSLASIGRDHHG